MNEVVIERPILFSDPMVRAILSGQKTQTRRVLKVQPPAELQARQGRYRLARDQDRLWLFEYEKEGDWVFHMRDAVYCPYGYVGDRLWVREAWIPLDPDHWIGDACFTYRASMSADSEKSRQEYIRLGRKYQWRPSIHMPRQASRITLEITSIRIERLHDITDADVVAEGVECCEQFQNSKRGHPLNAHRVGFAWLWKSINGEQSWLANPWVWVMEFQRC